MSLVSSKAPDHQIPGSWEVKVRTSKLHVLRELLMLAESMLWVSSVCWDTK